MRTAAAADGLSTLAAAIEAAGLVHTLRGRGPFTVFAPTDAAFADLPAGTLETRLRPENRARLAEILTYHVVPAEVGSAVLAGRDVRVLTVQGDRLTVRDRGAGPRVDGARIVAADVAAANGVVHVIDRVLRRGGARARGACGGAGLSRAWCWRCG